MPGNVKVLKATRPAEAGERRLQRVAAYCRVSTLSEEQESSYEAQVSHYTAFIAAHPGWILAGIYADEGITGTSTKNRERFNRMIEACEAGQIDLILTKSVSRFARNTLDCLNYIRKLKALGIPILFEKEGINTMDLAGEVLVTILASIAQQESASISANVRMGIVYGFQEGRGRFNYSGFLGLTKDRATGKIVIVPQEAEVVRRIFRQYLEGYSPYHIAKRLEEEGIRTPTGRDRWFNSTVHRMLRNEKYCGVLLMQKYFVEDYLTHKSVKNNGQRPQYVVEDNHDPIVPKEVFRLVQEELRRRKTKTPELRVICGECGRAMRPCIRSDGKTVDWRCGRRTSSGGEAAETGAKCRGVKASALEAGIVAAVNRLGESKTRMERSRDRLRQDLARLEEEMQQIPTGEDTSEDDVPDVSEEEAARREALRVRYAEAAVREMHLRFALDLIRQLAGEPAPEKTKDPACRTADEFFARSAEEVPGIADGRLTEYSADLSFRFVERVTVEAARFDVAFKCGVEIGVERGS